MRSIPPSERPERPQILWITLLLCAAAVPLGWHLAPQISAFFLVVVAIRLAALRWPALLPGIWPLIGLTLIGVANALITYQGWSGQSAGTALFISMLVLKLMELRRKGDLRLVATLIGFLIVVQFLFDQSPLLALYLAAVAFAVVTLLVELNIGLGSRRLRATLGIAARLSLQALPLTLVLFVLFPRLSAPLWSLGLDGGRGMTGMSDSMEPGAISELVLNGELAFRVRFDASPPSAEQLYWRGPVLWETDGRRWTPGSEALPDAGLPHALESASEHLQYEVTLEPTDQRWLFALDLPETVPAEAHLSPDYQLLAREPITSAKRYVVTSALAYRTAPADPARQAAGLQLPPNITPRMRRLVERWRGQTQDDWALVQAALTHFNQEDFHYTLLPPRLGANPTDEFLFETRRGFCEHYANSFVVLMRLAGIPARVVLGYLGGERNRVGGYHMVWQSDAHAWAEVLIAGRGWVRVDPTAAVNPARVDNRGASRMLGASPSVRFTLEQADALARFARTLRLFGDSLDAAWQDWVLGFSIEDQLAVLERLRLGELREYGLVVLMISTGALTLAILVLGSIRERQRVAPLEAAYARFCQRLARIGLARRAQEGPLDYGRRVSRARPDLAPDVARVLEIYLPARYGPAPDPQAAAALSRLLRAFRPRRVAPRAVRPVSPMP
ncbi:transglutaminase TgpA family protein [Thiocapsa imhoffii]